MSKNTELTQFQRLKNELEQQVSTLQRTFTKDPKQTKDKLSKIESKMQTMTKLFIGISSDFRSVRTNDAFNTRNKIDKCTQDKNRLRERIDFIRDELAKSELLSGGRKKEPQTQAARLMMDLTDRFQNVNKDLNETHQVVVNANNDVKLQGQLIEEIEGEAQAAEGQLTMVEQLTKIINNRQLVTRLILLFLVVIFGVADFFILILRII